MAVAEMTIYCLTLSAVYQSNYLSLLPPLILQFTNASPAWQECGGTDYVPNKKAHVLSLQVLGSWQPLILKSYLINMNEIFICLLLGHILYVSVYIIKQ